MDETPDSDLLHRLFCMFYPSTKFNETFMHFLLARVHLQTGPKTPAGRTPAHGQCHSWLPSFSVKQAVKGNGPPFRMKI